MMLPIHRMRARGRTVAHVVARVVTIALTVATIGAVLAAPSVARTQRSGDATPTRSIRMEGYWNRNRQAPGVLEALTFTSEIGGPWRPFGVTRMRAYKPDEEGVEVFRRSGLVPSIRVVGQTDMVRRFINAPETQKVTAYGVYRPATATLTLNSVQVGGS